MSKDQLKAVSDALHNGAEPKDLWGTMRLRLPLRIEDVSLDGAIFPQAHQEVCRRVNAHDDLVAVCKAFLNEWRYTLKDDYSNTPLAAIAEKAQAAIANAEKSL